MSQPPAVGIIGLGLLGTAIAERLLAAGFSVFGHDINTERGRHLCDIGGESVHQPESLCSECDVFLLSLPHSGIVASVMERICDFLRIGTTVIDTTTGDPEQMVAMGQFLAERETNYVEANVAGSSTQVRDAAATLFLGGDMKAVEACQALLAAIAPQRLYLGPVGAASRFKLVHNLILGLHRAVLAEGLYFAESLGFSATEALEVLKQTPAASAVMLAKGEKMATRDFEAQARLSQHFKDVRLILQQAERNGIHLPLSDIHQQLLAQAELRGFGDADNSAIIEAFGS